MGSTTIAALNQMVAKGQNSAVAVADSKKEKLTEAFEDCMQQISSQLNQIVSSSGQQRAEFSVKVENGACVDGRATDYDNNCQYRRTQVKSCDENHKSPEPEKISEVVEAYGQDVKETIQSSLDVTEEELEAAMDTLGLSILDLTNPANLAKLTAELMSADNVEDVLFLTDFQQLMQNVGSLTADLAQELQMPAEQLTELLADMQPVEESEISEIPVAEEFVAEQTPVTEVQASEQEVLMANDNPAMTQDAVVHADTVTNTTGTGQQAEVVDEQREVSLVKEVDATEEAAYAEKAEMPVSENESEAEDTFVSTVISVEKDSDSLSEEGGLASKQESFSGQTAEQNQSEAHVAAAADVGVKVSEFAEAVEQPVSYSGQVDTADVIRQIVEFAQLHTTEHATTLEMQLNPEHLGKLYLHLTSEEGAVTAKIYTQNELVREALEAQMADLKVNMSQAGIKVEAVEISAEPHAFEHNLEQQAKQDEQNAEDNKKYFGQHRQINLNDMDDMDRLSGLMSEEEALVARIMADNGNSVDFMA